MILINSLTGKEPTAAERQSLKQRAVDIFANAYASPEQLKWAIEVYPEGFAIVMYPECHKTRMEAQK